MTRPAIVDTNVIVAGLLSNHAASPPVRILDAMLSGTIPFALSPELFAEYREVLLRPKLGRLHGLSIAEIDAILTDLAALAYMLDPSRSDVPAPDPDDQFLWDLLDFRPDLTLVTGDKALLEPQTMRRRIMTPFAFCQTWTEEPFPTS